MRDDKGKEADVLVTRIDPGVVSLVAEVSGREQQTGEELGQWKTVVEERKVIDASPAAVTLAMICTREQLEEMQRRALTSQLELEREQKTSA